MVTHASQPTEISLLGTVTVLGLGGAPVSLGIVGPTLELFAYLVSFNRRSVRRDYLADMLWEDLDADRSRAALNTALWRVRQAVRGLRGLTLFSDAKMVRMDVDDTVMLDTARLRSVMQTAIAAFSKDNGLHGAVRSELDEVLTRFDGSFMEGSSSSWVLVEREEYLNLRLRGLTMLMQDAGINSMYEDALSHGRRILAVDPFREAVQCEMLWLYMMSGRRAFAIRHYREYEQMLRRELGIAPMAETRAVHDMICSDVPVPEPQVRLLGAAVAQPPARVSALLGEIEKDRRSFYRSHFALGT
jgi:DNA-binding SARP family transcriptional activator